jgi:hypothetical protein
MGGQGAAVRPPPSGARLPLGRGFLLILGVAGGLDLLGLLQAELQLLLGQALGPPPEAMPLQFLDDLAQPLAFCLLGQQHRLEQVRVVGEGCSRARHGPSESCPLSVRDGFRHRF